MAKPRHYFFVVSGLFLSRSAWKAVHYPAEPPDERTSCRAHKRKVHPLPQDTFRTPVEQSVVNTKEQAIQAASNGTYYQKENCPPDDLD
jgi:hypothetical protein